MKCPYCSNELKKGGMSAKESFHWEPGKVDRPPEIRFRSSGPSKNGVAISIKKSFLTTYALHIIVINAKK